MYIYLYYIYIYTSSTETSINALRLLKIINTQKFNNEETALLEIDLSLTQDNLNTRE